MRQHFVEVSGEMSSVRAPGSPLVSQHGSLDVLFVCLTYKITYKKQYIFL